MIRSAIYLMVFSLFLLSCETDDVVVPGGEEGPTVTISSNQINISEDGGLATVVATLSASHTENVIINLDFSGSASQSDYSESASSITVPAGAITGSMTITAIQDDLEEGNESVVVGIGSVQNGSANGFQQLTINIEDDDVEQVPQLILNEVLYDPSNNALDGDANNDGVYNQADDEFLEFVNLSSLDLDVSGYKIFDDSGLAANTPNHLFPDGSIIPAGAAMVVFGGGTPTGSFGGAVVQTSTSGDFNMTNAGDVMYLINADGNVVIAFDIEPLSNNPNESYTRNPDLTGDFVQHGSVVPGVLFSPGTKSNGTAF
ncbi:MAG: endonuclease [Cryomorphaceae bacterium]|nr:endonuclease [Cryomorphaceae bacterium]